MPIGGRVDNVKDPDDLRHASKVPTGKGVAGKIEIILSESKYRFEDLIVPQSTLTEIHDALAFYKYNNLVMNEWGLSKTHKNFNKICINFYGPPGTGKTMAAHAVAHSLKKKLLIVNYADIESKYVGETPKNLSAMFVAADESDAIIFFDEADALLSRRVSDMRGANDTSVNQTRSVLLNILNDYQRMVLFATNFIENFDPAFMRRIAAHVKFDLPDYNNRRKILAAYIPDEMPNAIDIDVIALRYSQVSGSDISNAVMKAAFSAAARCSNVVEMVDIDSAFYQIQQGKKENSKNHIDVQSREVTKEYVESNLGRSL